MPDALVHAGGADPQEHLAPAGDGRLGLFEAQHFGRSVGVLDDGSHGVSPSVAVAVAVPPVAEYWNTWSSGTPKTAAIWKAISSEGE